MRTVMGETVTEGSSDAGSIPASSISCGHIGKIPIYDHEAVGGKNNCISLCLPDTDRSGRTAAIG